ncbi:MAG: DoxX family protein [Gammaproteobacteria bacterium]|nr:DoxX family protein [Gammaproteobacteria bacterium]MYF62644.1 DoxX family protein [Gammaproteobacteria bacterium]MYI21240.1 DoxX family protein [Gammaproteobacteria bacterium]
MADKGSRGITIVSVLLALLFLLNGGMKLAGMMVEQFEMWGYSGWFQYLIGIAEAAAGVGFLMKKARFLAAVAMVPVMLGAIYTLVTNGQTGQAVVPLVALLLCLLVAKNSR